MTEEDAVRFEELADANTAASSAGLLWDSESLRSELGAFRYPEVSFPVAEEAEGQAAAEVADEPIYAALV